MKLNRTQTALTYWSIFIGVFAYVVFRAFHLSFTHDESLTFSILFGNEAYTNSANNHFLNTYLMSFCLRLWSDTEGVLRLPNVLGFVVYAFFAYKISKVLSGTYLPILCFLLLLLNPFILDFFSLARGYGLSLAMMVACIYFLLKILTRHKSLIDNYLFALFSIYAVIANFTLLIFYLSAMTVWGLIWLYHEKGKVFLRFIPLSILLAHGVILFYLMQFLFYLKSINGLYAGGSDGFIKSIVESNVVGLLYNDHLNAVLLKNILVYGVLLSIAIVLILNFSTIKKKSLLQPVWIFVILLTLSSIIPIVQNRLLGILYPTERTATFYYILWALYMFFLQVEKPFFKRIHVGMLWLFTAFILFNFIRTANVKYSNVWKYDANTKDMILTVNRLRNEKQIPDTVKLTVFWLYHPTTDIYYRSRLYYDWLTVSRFEVDKKSTDMLYYLPMEEASKEPFRSQFSVLKYYDDTQTLLLKKQ